MKLRLLALLPMLALTGCGFQPMYGSHSSSPMNIETSAAMSSMEISNIPDRDGQFLRNELIDELTPHGTLENPRYRLSFSDLDMTIRELDLTKNSEATRSQIIATIAMTLTDLETHEVLLTRSLKSISSYNILPSEFATNVTEQNARETALKDIARQMELQLSLYFNRGPSADEATDKTDRRLPKVPIQRY